MTERPTSAESGADPVVIVIAGELDMAREPEIVSLLMSLDAAPETPIDMDMSEVTFVDSGGLRALLKANVYLANRGCDLRLVNPQDQLVRLIDLAGVHRFLTIGFRHADRPAEPCRTTSASPDASP
ncbi:MAG: anti-sigma factor antagonist [Acidimicrobiaceae bacterium]|nr:anti-sigma factor antagonist [Acidimicrobiaceae bacterium]